MRIALVSFLLLLTGCASVQNAGTAEYSVKPVVIGEKTVCCEVTVRNGKNDAKGE